MEEMMAFVRSIAGNREAMEELQRMAELQRDKDCDSVDNVDIL